MVLQTNSPKEANEMLTKTRTAIIALVAAGSFATATVAPTVAQAKTRKVVVTVGSAAPTVAQAKTARKKPKTRKVVVTVGVGDVTLGSAANKLDSTVARFDPYKAYRFRAGS
jgi:hypothetical protein